MSEIEPRYGMVVVTEWSGRDPTLYMLVAPGSNAMGDGWSFVMLRESYTVGPLGDAVLLRFPPDHGWKVVAE